MNRQSVYHSLLTAFQSELIRRALAATGGNRTHAARLLGVQRTYMLKLMRDRGIEVPRSRRKGQGLGGPRVTAATPPEIRVEIIGWESLTPTGDDRRA